MKTYTITESDECSGAVIARVQGPETPGFVELYHEFLTATEFPFEGGRDGMSFCRRDYFDQRSAWETIWNEKYAEFLYTEMHQPHFPTQVSVNTLFVAWLINEKGFSLIEDDTVNLCTGGPESADWWTGEQRAYGAPSFGIHYHPDYVCQYCSKRQPHPDNEDEY